MYVCRNEWIMDAVSSRRPIQPNEEFSNEITSDKGCKYPERENIDIISKLNLNQTKLLTFLVAVVVDFRAQLPLIYGLTWQFVF